MRSTIFNAVLFKFITFTLLMTIFRLIISLTVLLIASQSFMYAKKLLPRMDYSSGRRSRGKMKKLWTLLGYGDGSPLARSRGIAPVRVRGLEVEPQKLNSDQKTTLA